MTAQLLNMVDIVDLAGIGRKEVFEGTEIDKDTGIPCDRYKIILYRYVPGKQKRLRCAIITDISDLRTSEALWLLIQDVREKPERRKEKVLKKFLREYYEAACAIVERELKEYEEGADLEDQTPQQD